LITPPNIISPWPRFSLRHGLALTLLVNGLLAAWVLLRPVTGPGLVDVDYLIQTLGGVLGGVFCFLPWGRPRSSLPRPALLCGLGRVCLCRRADVYHRLPAGARR